MGIALMGGGGIGRRVVPTEGLADGAVTTAKISDLAVIESKLADGAVTNVKVAVAAAIASTKLSLGDTETTDSGLNEGVWQTPTDPDRPLFVFGHILFSGIGAGENAEVQIQLRDGADVIQAGWNITQSRGVLGSGTDRATFPFAFTVPRGWDYRFNDNSDAGVTVASFVELLQI